MTVRRLRYVCFALGIVLAGGQALAQAPLRVGVDQSFPPLAFETEDGRMAGFDIDVVYAICAELKQRCELVPTPFGDIIAQLRSGGIDFAVASMTITNDRRKLVDFSIPYYRGPNRFVGRSELAPLFSNDEPLTGLVIGVREGSTYAHYAVAELASANKVISYPFQEELYLDLAQNRLDVILANELAAGVGFLQTEMGRDHEALGVRLGDVRFFGDGEAVAVRKGRTELRAAINSAIEQLIRDGGLDRIWSGYFPQVPRDATASD